MRTFHLVENITRDKLIHQGIYFEPAKKGKRALLWVPGLASTFYSNIPLMEEFATQCDGVGFGFAAFNTRGHDIVTGIKRIDKRKPKGYSRVTIGAGIETFKECIFDIESGISFLVSQEYKEVIVVGHSTGANKACYYAATQKDTRLTAVILAGPASDRLDPSLNSLKVKNDLLLMQDLVNKGKGDTLVSDTFFYPLTPRRFLSGFTPNSLEDQFDYGDDRPRMKYYSKIKKPLLVIFGSQDEYLDRPAIKVIEVFDEYQQSANYKAVIIKNALHSFDGQEKEFVSEIVSWSQSL